MPFLCYYQLPVIWKTSKNENTQMTHSENTIFVEDHYHLKMYFVQVNKALKLVRTKKQWADLGIQTGACLVLPETCGPEGAAMALWVNIQYCSGIISSFRSSSGLSIFCDPGYDLK